MHDSTLSRARPVRADVAAVLRARHRAPVAMSEVENAELYGPLRDAPSPQHRAETPQEGTR